MSLAVEKHDPFVHDNLFAGTQVQPVVADEVTIAEGAVLKRGTVIGKITASGLCVAVDSTLENGAQAVYGVLAEDTNAAEADKKAPAYFTGEYNEAALIFGGDDDADNHRDAARALGIFFKTNIPA